MIRAKKLGWAKKPMLQRIYANLPSLKNRTTLIVATVLLCLLICFIDYLTGNEVRMYPLYILPVGLIALFGNLFLSLFIILLSSILWVVSNILSGMHFSSDWVWIWNDLIQSSMLVVVAYLVSKIKESEKIQEDLARIDALTELPNKRSFNEQAPQCIELCKRLSLPVTIAYIDLDNFKEINTAHGHAIGDKVLSIAATSIKSMFRVSDLTFRMGGDEFVAILPNTNEETAQIVLERLRENIETNMSSQGYAVTASIGAVAYKTPPSDLDTIIKAADHKMYTVKHSGKNHVMIDVYTADNLIANP